MSGLWFYHYCPVIRLCVAFFIFVWPVVRFCVACGYATGFFDFFLSFFKTKETSKHPPMKVQPEIVSPSQTTHATLSPPLRSTQVVWDSVNLREGPGTTHKVIGNAKKGASLKIIEVQGDWLRVRLGNGSEAWVSKLATSEAPKPPPPPPPPPSNAPPPPKPTPM